MQMKETTEPTQPLGWVNIYGVFEVAHNARNKAFPIESPQLICSHMNVPVRNVHGRNVRHSCSLQLT